MGLNSVRYEFNIHYFNYFVRFKRYVDPTKLKSCKFYFVTSACRRLGSEIKTPNARGKNISASGIFQRSTQQKISSVFKSLQIAKNNYWKPASSKRPKNCHKGVLSNETRESGILLLPVITPSNLNPISIMNLTRREKIKTSS